MRDVAMQFYRINMTPHSNETALLLFSFDHNSPESCPFFNPFLQDPL
jgi:hypothetical protein